MADVFEDRADLNGERERLWRLLEETPNLDWLLLTKRPQNIKRLTPWKNDWPANVWLGTSVETQMLAEKRLPFLLKNAAPVRFLSCEPLLGRLDLRQWFKKKGFHSIDWIIAGGESGGHSRPMHPDWVLELLRQCKDFNVPFHFKQWGQWVPAEHSNENSRRRLIELNNERPIEMLRLSKKLAGRILQGTTWDGVPLTTLDHA